MKHLIIAAAPLFASPALADIECLPLAETIDYIGAEYGEYVEEAAWVTYPQEGLLVILVNMDTGTWTQLFNVGSCAAIVAAGNDWAASGMPV